MYTLGVATRQILEELTELPVMVDLASDFLDRKVAACRCTYLLHNIFTDAGAHLQRRRLLLHLPVRGDGRHSGSAEVSNILVTVLFISI